MQQTMLAIQALNPDAFINGNIAVLKPARCCACRMLRRACSCLRPGRSTKWRPPAADWRNGRRTVRWPSNSMQPVVKPCRPCCQGCATGCTEPGFRSGGQGATGDAKKLAEQLAMSQEGLDGSRRENAELQDRMKDLQSQLDKLQRLIELKNDQLARLEAGKKAPVDPAAALPVVQAADAPVKPILRRQSKVCRRRQWRQALWKRVRPRGMSEKIQDLLNSPLLLGLIGGGAILLLLLLLLLVRRRKALQEAQKHARMARDLEHESGFDADLDLPQSSFEGLETPSRSVDPAPAPAPAPVVEAVAAVAAPVTLARISAADVLDRAERLIERRQLSEAEALLKVAIDQERSAVICALS